MVQTDGGVAVLKDQLVATAGGVHPGLCFVQDGGPRCVGGELQLENEAEGICPAEGHGRLLERHSIFTGEFDRAGRRAIGSRHGDRAFHQVRGRVGGLGEVDELIGDGVLKPQVHHRTGDAGGVQGGGIAAQPRGQPHPGLVFRGRKLLRSVRQGRPQIDQLLILLGRGQQHRGYRHRVREIRGLTGFIDVLKKGEQPIEILLGNWVVLVIVAARTLQGQPEKRGAEGIDAIHNIGHAKFLLDDAALFVL